jgi:poly-gamma-glutamate synthesis protein (capsule biosynthesis protein)
MIHPCGGWWGAAANNHALDYEVKGLLDTFEHLEAAGIPYTGAGRGVEEARRPVILSHGDFKIGIIGAVPLGHLCGAGAEQRYAGLLDVV